MALRGDLVKLATQKSRYGYRRLHAPLSRLGQEVNVKRVYRLYVEEKLMVRRKRRKRLVRERAAEPRLGLAQQHARVEQIYVHAKRNFTETKYSQILAEPYCVWAHKLGLVVDALEGRGQGWASNHRTALDHHGADRTGVQRLS